MMIPEQSNILRFYSNATETWHGAPLYRTVVEEARRRKLAGASVFPVEMGFGAHRELHDIASEYSSFDIPIIVEIIDGAERVRPLMEELDTIVTEGLVVVSPVRVFRYIHASERIAGNEAPPSSCPPGPNSGANRILEKRAGGHMKIEGDAKRVTVYVGSTHTWKGRNLAVAIVETCRELGLAGATVSRGVMGFGKHSVIHKAHFLGLSDDLPERVEIVDRPEAIDRVLPILDEMIVGGLIVVEDVHVVRYLHDPKRSTS
jgi:PII-like signaling protein